MTTNIILTKAATNSILCDKNKYVLEYIWLNNIERQEIKNDIVLNILKNPSLIISLSPIIIADINSINVIIIHVINKRTITWNVKFFWKSLIPHCNIEEKLGRPIIQLSKSL